MALTYKTGILITEKESGHELGLIQFKSNGRLYTITWFKYGMDPYVMKAIVDYIYENGLSEEPIYIKYVLQLMEQNGVLTIEQLIPEVEYYARVINSKNPPVKFNDKLIFAQPIIYEGKEE